LAEAYAAARLRGIAQTLGRGAHLLLALSEQADEQGLREVVRNERSFRLRGDDASDGKTIGPCIGFSNSFSRHSSERFAWPMLVTSSR
jgi:hypothetical protein